MSVRVGTSEQRRYRAVDELTRQVLVNLAPLSFDTARTAEEVDAVLRMRYEIVVEMGWAKPEDFPDGRERDEHDEDATFVVCRDGDAIVGALRLIPPDPSGFLPIERDFEIGVEPPGTAVEAGRLVISRSFRGKRDHAVLAGLFSRCWLEARELGYGRIVAASPARVVELYRNLGLRVTLLGPSRVHWGQERVPVEIAETDATFARLAGT